MKSAPLAVVVASLVTTLAAPAGAQEAERDRGTRLILESDDGPAALAIDGVEVQQPEKPEGVSLGLRTRYVTVPDSLLDAIFLEHTSLDSWSLGLEVGIDGPAGSRVLFGVDYTSLHMPAGNFRSGDSLFTTQADPPNKASYTDVDLHLVALDVTFLWKLEIAPDFGFVYGVGLGLGITAGEITLTDVLPTCTIPVEECGHWNQVTQREADLPSPVWPLLTLQGGFYWDPIPELRIRLEGGFRGVLFAGTTVRTTF